MLRSRVRFDGDVHENEWRLGRSQKERKISLYNVAVQLIVTDVLIFVGSGVGFGLLFSKNSTSELADWQVWAIAFSVLMHLFFARLLNLYATETIIFVRPGIKGIALSVSFICLIILSVGVATKTSSTYSRLWFFSWMFSSLALISISRVFQIKMLQHSLKAGAYIFRALSVGIHADPLPPYEILRQSKYQAYVTETLSLASIPDLATLSEKIAHEEIDRVYISTDWNSVPLVTAEHLPLKASIYPGLRAALRKAL